VVIEDAGDALALLVGVEYDTVTAFLLLFFFFFFSASDCLRL
jgi:hypothetical protein